MEERKKESETVDRDKQIWDIYAVRYDNWYKRFEGAIEHYIDWEILKRYLPKKRNARILDAAGGTGRITLPLAKMGYNVTFCDSSPAMLKAAKKKIEKNGLLDNVNFYECDISKLDFEDEIFDFILCWGGVSEDASEQLLRVTKKGGWNSLFLTSRCRLAIDKFQEDNEIALSLIESDKKGRKITQIVEGYPHEILIVNPEEAKEYFRNKGVINIDIYSYYGMLRYLKVSEGLIESEEWEEDYFKNVARILLGLCKEPSVAGLAKHFVLYGRKK